MSENNAGISDGQRLRTEYIYRLNSELSYLYEVIKKKKEVETEIRSSIYLAWQNPPRQFRYLLSIPSDDFKPSKFHNDLGSILCGVFDQEKDVMQEYLNDELQEYLECKYIESYPDSPDRIHHVALKFMNSLSYESTYYDGHVLKAVKTSELGAINEIESEYLSKEHHFCHWPGDDKSTDMEKRLILGIYPVKCENENEKKCDASIFRKFHIFHQTRKIVSEVSWNTDGIKNLKELTSQIKNSNDLEKQSEDKEQSPNDWQMKIQAKLMLRTIRAEAEGDLFRSIKSYPIYSGDRIGLRAGHFLGTIHIRTSKHINIEKDIDEYRGRISEALFLSAHSLCIGKIDGFIKESDCADRDLIKKIGVYIYVVLRVLKYVQFWERIEIDLKQEKWEGKKIIWVYPEKMYPEGKCPEGREDNGKKKEKMKFSEGESSVLTEILQKRMGSDSGGYLNRMNNLFFVYPAASTIPSCPTNRNILECMFKQEFLELLRIVVERVHIHVLANSEREFRKMIQKNSYLNAGTWKGRSPRIFSRLRSVVHSKTIALIPSILNRFPLGRKNLK